jgi:hypothetical protein
LAVSKVLGQQAIVVGGSIAGLLAARVLSDYFDQVLVLNADRIEDRPVVHKSVRRAITFMPCYRAALELPHRYIRRSHNIFGNSGR